jgi:plastocyanin
MTRNRIRGSVVLGTFLLLAGCGGGDAPAGTSASGEAAAAVEPTGTVHEIKMISGSGERFEPGDLVVKRGDVLRFVLVAGVHNASFPADKNPAGVKLPAATPYLQAPGQTHDMVVDLPPGEYYYHCDPHVALGMNANLTVVE